MFKEYKEAMLSYLPWYDKENEIIINVCRCLELAFRDLDRKYDFVYSNLFLDTAVEMLPLYIKKLGLKVGDDVSIEDKRQYIQAYMHYLHQQTTKKIVAEMVAGRLNGENIVNIEKDIEVDVYQIFMQVSLLKEQNIDDVYYLLRKIMPAHLDFILNLLISNNLILIESTRSFVSPFYMVGTNLYKSGQIFRHQYVGRHITENVNLGNKGAISKSRYRHVGEDKAGRRGGK